jgi:hypothetical protein
MKGDRRNYGIASLVSLFIGFGIYLFFRKLNILLFNLIPKPGFLENVFVPVRHSVFSSILLYNIPDALWFLSGILLIRFIWFGNKKWQRIYILCFYGVALIIETSQLSKNIPGTFDILDLLFMGITALIEGLLYKYSNVKKMMEITDIEPALEKLK